RRFRRNIQPDHAAEPQTFAQVAAALIEKSPDGTKLAGAVEPLDRIASGIDDLSPHVSPRTALSVEQTRPERDAVKPALQTGKRLLPATEFFIHSSGASAPVGFYCLMQARAVFDAELTGEVQGAIAASDPILADFFPVVLAPSITTIGAMTDPCDRALQPSRFIENDIGRNAREAHRFHVEGSDRHPHAVMFQTGLIAESLAVLIDNDVTVTQQTHTESRLKPGKFVAHRRRHRSHMPQ